MIKELRKIGDKSLRNQNRLAHGAELAKRSVSECRKSTNNLSCFTIATIDPAPIT